MRASPAVLVVDSSDVIRRSLCAWLGAEFPECRCLEALSAEQALWTAVAERPSAILVDVDMPGVEGFRILRRLSALEGSIPLIAMSAHDADHYRAYATGAGACACTSLDARDPGLERLLGPLLRGGAPTAVVPPAFP